MEVIKKDVNFDKRELGVLLINSMCPVYDDRVKMFNFWVPGLCNLLKGVTV